MQVGILGETLCTVGGQFIKGIAAASGTTTLKAAPGRLCRIVITVAGTASITVFDNASAASGTVLFISPATTSVGQIFDIQMPAQNGITVSNPASSPGFTASWD
jgi:hypothetical protein